MDISSLLLSLALKSSVVLLISLAVVGFIKCLSSSERHFIWSLTFLSLILLPLLTAVMPKYQLTVPFTEFSDLLWIDTSLMSPREINTTVDLPENDNTWFSSIVAGMKGIDPGLAFSVLYLLFMSAFLSYLCFIYYRISRSLQSLAEIKNPFILDRVRDVCTELSINREIVLLESKQDHSPWTWGVVYPKIILPAGFHKWIKEEQHNALIHELSHIKRCDLISFLLARLCCCIYWFHPLAWIGYRKMVMEAEKACDDRVLLSGSKASMYADQLMSVANSIFNGGKKQPLYAAMARCSSLTQRIRGILDGEIRRNSINGQVASITFISTLALSVTLVACQVVANQPDRGITNSKSAENTSQQIDKHKSGAVRENGENVPAGNTDMRKGVYEKLKEVEKLYESGRAEDGIAILEDLDADSSLSPYERAQVHNYLAYIYFKAGKNDESINHYLKVLEQQDIPKVLVTNSTYTLSQLYFAQGRYEDAIDRMDQWLELTDRPTANGYIILGQAYYELNNYKESIVALNKAHNLLKENSEKPGINLLLLMRLDYWKLEDQENIDRMTREMVELYPDSIHDQDFEAANNISALNKYLPINKVEPVYPPRALKRGIEGYVIVEFTVTKEGRTKDIHVVEASHTAIFDRAALQAAAKFRYKPMVINGKTVEVPGVLNKITFAIEDKADQK